MWESFLGVFLGAFAGALIAARFQAVENQRVEYRRTNATALGDLGHTLRQFLHDARDVAPDFSELLKEEARRAPKDLLRWGDFDPAEKTALDKAGEVTAAGIDEIRVATETRDILDAYSRAAAAIEDNLLVIWRGVDDVTGAGWRETVSHLWSGYR